MGECGKSLERGEDEQGGKARRYFGEGRGMGIPEGGGTVDEDCLGGPEAQINFRQFAGLA